MIARQASSYTTPTYYCPDANGETFTDSYGIAWIIGCGIDTTGGSYTGVGVADSWDECFAQCANNYLNPTVGNPGDSTNCTAFTYVGADGGHGGGTCYVKNYNSESFTNSNTGTGFCAAIRVQNYVAGSYAPTYTGAAAGAGAPAATTTTTTTTSLPSSSSSSSSGSVPTSPQGASGISCPASDGQTVTDPYGIQYTIGCGHDTGGGNYNVYTAPNENFDFTDCFYYSHNSQTMDGRFCSNVVYSGGPNGVGYGQCFVKDGTGSTFTSSDNNHVAMIRVSDQSVSPQAPQGGSQGGVTTTTTVSQAISGQRRHLS